MGTAVEAFVKMSIAHGVDESIVAMAMGTGLKHHPCEVKSLLLESLARESQTGVERVMSMVMLLLEDQDWEVRRVAVISLAKIATPYDEYAISAVRACLTDQFCVVRFAAEDALAKLC